MLVTLRDVPRPLPYSEEVDPERAFRLAMRAGWPETDAAAYAAHQAGLPLVDGEGPPIRWTIREVRHLRFLRREVGRGHLTGDCE